MMKCYLLSPISRATVLKQILIIQLPTNKVSNSFEWFEDSESDEQSTVSEEKEEEEIVFDQHEDTADINSMDTNNVEEQPNTFLWTKN